jgi:hypothetical protein
MIQRKLISLGIFAALLVSISGGVAEEIKQTDLGTQRLIAHIAYQLGKNDASVPKPLVGQPVTTANGVMSASIDELTPVSGSTLDASNVQVVNCHAKFEWPNQKVSTADEEIPVIMVLSFNEKQTGRVWSLMGKPLLRLDKGQPSTCENGIGYESTLPPGNYSVTALLFARLSPEKPPTLLDVKSTEFVVVTPNK